MGSSSSISRTDVSNSTTTTTTTFANAFNNALNTTQNFSNIGGASPSGGSTFGDISYSVIIAAVLGFLGFFILIKKGH